MPRSLACHVSSVTFPFFVRIETNDGTANENTDYKPLKQSLVLEKDEAQAAVEVEIIDDNEWEPDEVFFVKLSLDSTDPSTHSCIIGHHSICEVTIINDDGRPTACPLYSLAGLCISCSLALQTPESSSSRSPV